MVHRMPAQLLPHPGPPPSPPALNHLGLLDDLGHRNDHSHCVIMAGGQAHHHAWAVCKVPRARDHATNQKNMWLQYGS